MKLYGRRALLNKPGHESVAAIVAELVEGKWGWEPTLRISDCVRSVTLDLCDPAHEETTDEQFENDMYKLDTIIGSVQELQKGMRRVRRRSGR